MQLWCRKSFPKLAFSPTLAVPTPFSPFSANRLSAQSSRSVPGDKQAVKMKVKILQAGIPRLCIGLKTKQAHRDRQNLRCLGVRDEVTSALGFPSSRRI